MPNPNLPINARYNTYIGARYVPKFADPIDWDELLTYEPLTIVLYQGDSYTSKTFVPAGVSPTTEQYWAKTGNYNAQIETLAQELNNKAEIRSVGILADDIGVTPSNTGNVNSSILQDFLTSNKNNSFEIVFADDIYNFSSSITFYPGQSFKGVSTKTQLNYDGSGAFFRISEEAVSSDFAWKYRYGTFSSLIIEQPNFTKTATAIQLGLPEQSGLINIPFFTLKNLVINGFSTGVYIEGYGHLMEKVLCRYCSVGFDIVHPEQDICIGCWAEYANTGVQVNVTKPNKYGSLFTWIGGAVQRNTVGFNIVQCRNVNISTYHELNTHEDIILGDVSKGYSAAVSVANINIATESSTREEGYYAINLQYSSNINASVYCATNNANIIKCDGYSKNIRLYTDEHDYNNSIIGDAVKSFSYNVKNIENYMTARPRTVRQFSTNVAESIGTDLSRTGLMYNIASGLYEVSSDSDSVILFKTNGIRKIMVSNGEVSLGDTINLMNNSVKVSALRFNTETNTLQVQIGSAWHNIVTD